DRQLLVSALVGIAAFALILAGTAILFASDRAVAAVGRAAQWLRNEILRRREPRHDLPERLVPPRETVNGTLGHPRGRPVTARGGLALTAAGGRSLLDFLALLCALSAVGTTARPGLVLLAYVAASLLGMIPITPGGLGFVEAGLSSTLVLAGVSAADAVLATLAYRLPASRLPPPARPLPSGPPPPPPPPPPAA